MPIHSHNSSIIQIPFEDPVLIFSLVLFIIFFTNIALRRTRVPGILGLILAGILVGPNGLNLLQRDASIILFGTVGLMYIMFLAGIEINLNEFKRNTSRSITFGMLTFLIPMTIGTTAAYYILNMPIVPAILLASMFASHTLIAYPIVSKMGLTREATVSMTVGGTIITDTLALLVLAVIIDSTRSPLDAAFWIRLILSFGVFVFLVLWGIPRIGRYFFKHADNDGILQYIFVLAMAFLAAFLAQVAGVEPIIGAFLAGLALSTLVPSKSSLMNRIEFVGNALFIPFFLIGVGMLVDVRILFSNWHSIFVGLIMTIAAVTSKWSAAYFTQKVFRFSKIQRSLIFGLSNAQTAATLAAVMIAYNIGLFDDTILNGTIMMILITCLISSCVVQSAAEKIAVEESDKVPDMEKTDQRILVPIANPLNIESLLNLAIMIKNPLSEEPIFPLAVVKDDENTKTNISLNKVKLEKAVKYASAAEKTVRVISRVDTNIANGVVRAIKELMITEVIVGWNGEIRNSHKVLGSVLDHVIEDSSEPILISKIMVPLNVLNQLTIVVPPFAQRDAGFARWIKIVKSLADQTTARMVFYGSPTTLEAILDVLHDLPPIGDVRVVGVKSTESIPIPAHIDEEELLIAVSARRNSPTFGHHLEEIPKTLAAGFKERSFIIIYP